MMTLLSPAKKLDFETPLPAWLPKPCSAPQWHDRTLELVGALRGRSAEELGELMGLSSKLAQLNYSRYQNFPTAKNTTALRPALYTFRGDTYQTLDAQSWLASPADLTYVQDHLRILSGLYGLLRPQDGIAAHRLEMSTSLAVGSSKNLYEYWSKHITSAVGQLCGRKRVLVNAASQAYIKAVNLKDLHCKVVHVVFKEITPGGLKTIGLMAKKARGHISQFILQNKLQRPEDLQHYQGLGYRYRKDLSSSTHFVFARKPPAPMN